MQRLLVKKRVIHLGFWLKKVCILLAAVSLPFFAKAQANERVEVKTETFLDKSLNFWQNANPLAEGKAAPPPPEQKPFELPRLYNDDEHYNLNTKPLKKAPKIDPDAVFLAVIDCFPSQSTFNAELSLVGGFRQALDEFDDDYPDIASHYVGVVGKIPLYSSNERARQREREYRRRTETSQQVAGFIKAIAARNQAYRELGLYRALEARSQARVSKGIAETSEQVRMLEKITKAHSDVISEESNIIEHRLALAGLCESSKREAINNWLKKMVQL